MIMVPLGGIAGVSVAILLLWVGFGMDPFGLFEADAKPVAQTPSDTPAAPPLQTRPENRRPLDPPAATTETPTPNPNPDPNPNPNLNRNLNRNLNHGASLPTFNSLMSFPRFRHRLGPRRSKFQQVLPRLKSALSAVVGPMKHQPGNMPAN